MISYPLFWIPVPFLILLGFIFNREVIIDTGMNQSHIELSTLMLFYGAFLIFSGLGYYLFRGKEMNRALNSLHWGPTFVGLAWLAADALGWIGPGGSDMIAGVVLLIGTGITCYLINLTVTTVSLLLSK